MDQGMTGHGDADADLRSRPVPTGDKAPDTVLRLSEGDWYLFKAEIRQLLAAIRPRARAQEQSIRQITHRAMEALDVIATAITSHPGTGQASRLVRFVAGCYNGSDYPFDLTELRGLDTSLVQACLDYLDYDRLGIREIHHHLHGGDLVLHQWLRRYEVRVVSYVTKG